MYLLISFIIITCLLACFFNYLKNKILGHDKNLFGSILEAVLQVGEL